MAVQLGAWSGAEASHLRVSARVPPCLQGSYPLDITGPMEPNTVARHEHTASRGTTLARQRAAAFSGSWLVVSSGRMAGYEGATYLIQKFITFFRKICLDYISI